LSPDIGAEPQWRGGDGEGVSNDARRELLCSLPPVDKGVGVITMKTTAIIIKDYFFE